MTRTLKKARVGIATALQKGTFLSTGFALESRPAQEIPALILRDAPSGETAQTL